jgi:hypothetical protein
VDAAGGLLGAPIAGANIHDTKLLAATLVASVVDRHQLTAAEPQRRGKSRAKSSAKSEPITRPTTITWKRVFAY